MSADNCVAILVTSTDFDRDGNGGMTNRFGNPKPVYRVAHTQGIDCFDWYEANQPYNLGAVMISVWGKSKAFETAKEAREEAIRLEEKSGYVEYGILTIDRQDLTFYGD